MLRPLERYDASPLARQAVFLVLVLLGVDAAFASLHVLWSKTDLVTATAFNIEYEYGYGSLWQFGQTAAVAVLLAGAAWRHRTVGLAAWGALFAYVLLDDALALHERAGGQFGQLDAPPVFLGLRARDLGEVAFLAAVGLLLLVPIAAAYVRGGGFARRTTQVLIGLLGVAVFFGVGVDFVHALVSQTRLNGTVGFIEDAGELMAMSLVAGYAFYLYRLSPRAVAARPERSRPHAQARL